MALTSRTIGRRPRTSRGGQALGRGTTVRGCAASGGGGIRREALAAPSSRRGLRSSRFPQRALMQEARRAPEERGGPTGLLHQWRWRESNPRPLAWSQAFSGRSLLRHFSAPTITQASRRAGHSHCSCRRKSRDRALGQWPSSRRQQPGRRRARTDGVSHSLRRRGRTRCCWNWHLLVCGEVYEITPPSRPASPGTTSNVETCHPLCSCQPWAWAHQNTLAAGDRRPRRPSGPTREETKVFPA